MADEKITEQTLEDKEAELTKLLLMGMPSKTEIRIGGTAPGKLAAWEKGHAPLIKPWREVRGRLGLSTEIESIRPE